MSVVTGMVLVTASHEKDTLLLQVDAWLRKERLGWSLGHDLSDGNTGGGSKHPQLRLFCAGLNYFDRHAEFRDFLNSLPWDSPENVILLLQPEEECETIVERFA